MTNPPLPQPGEPPVANETIAVPCTCWLGEPTRDDCPKHGGQCAECGAARATHTRGDQSYCDEIQALRAENAQMREAMGPLARLGLWALDTMREDASDLDGGDVQDKAEAFGVVAPVPFTGPCCENCPCAEYESDVCYRDTDATKAARALLNPTPEGNDNG